MSSGKGKIQSMLKEGKLTPEQSELLSGAIDHSEKRREQVLQDSKQVNNEQSFVAKLSLKLCITFVTVLVVSVLGLLCLSTYNRIVILDNNTDASRAQIAAVLQRRMDLIPNLVETVKGYAKHEKETLTAVMAARAQAQGSLDKLANSEERLNADMDEIIASQTVLSGSLRSVLALVERYPDLKANSNFMALQDQLEGTENRISVQRQRYNSDVKVYNTKIQTLPGNIVAAIMNFEEKDYFEAKQEANDAPKIKF